jgi:Ca2+-binding EF-hand superfamily protein
MMTAKMTEKDSKEELQKAFRLFDAEGSGRITLEALRHVALELGEDLKDEELREMIEEADRDKKGYVTEKDFLNLMKKATQYFV